MANIKITELNAASSLASTDVVPVVDVSEDVTKKITATDLFRTLPDGTAAAPALAFSSDQANGVYLAGTDTVGISTGGTQRVTVDGSGNVTISGDLQVNGATTTVQSTTVTIDDKNIELGSVASPSNTTADGGGITLKGATDKTLKWINSTGCWTFNQPMNFNDHVRIDSSGQVGIGTTSPSSYGGAVKLALTSSGNTSFTIASGTSSDGTILFADGTSGDATYRGQVKYSHSSDAMLFNTAATERLRIDSSGRLLVGLTSSANRFHVKETNTNTIVGVLESSAAYSYQSLQASGTTAGAVRVGANANNFVVNAGSAERLRIDSSGNVGIGTTSVDRLLHVQGAGTSGTQVQIEGTSASAGLKFVPASGDNWEVQATTNSDLIVYNRTDNAHRLTIDSSGRVGIGTTSPSNLLHISGSSAAQWIQFDGSQSNLLIGQNTGTSHFGQTNATKLMANNASNPFVIGNNQAQPLILGTSSAERMRIDSSGRLLVGATSSTNLIRLGQAFAVSTTSDFGGGSFTGFNGTTANEGPILDLQRSRGTSTVGTVVASGDRLGSLVFRGDDVTNFADAAFMLGEVDGTPSGGFVPGRFAFYTGTTSAVPAERMRIDSSGNVGIGETTPDAKLHVAYSAGNPQIIIERTTNSTAKYGLHAFSNTFTIKDEAQSQERLRIDSSGNVGIGVSSLNSSSRLTLLESAGNARTLEIKGANSGGVGSQPGVRFSSFNGDNIGGIFGDTGSDALRIQTGGTDRIYVTNGGNVGIGDSGPGHKLVVKDAGATNTSNYLNVISGNAANAGIAFGDTDTDLQAGILYLHSDNALRFFKSGFTEAARIDSSGRLLIGTSTSPSGGDSHSQNAPLLIQGRIGSDADSGRINLQRGSAASSGSSIGTISFTDSSNNAYARLEVEADAATGSNDYPGRIKFSTTADGASSPTERMRIDNAGTISCFSASAPMVWGRAETSGNVTALAFYNNPSSITSFSGQVFRVMCDGDVENSNNAYGSISDIKLKENIVDAGSQWNDIKGLRVRKYNFKESTGLSTHTQIGLVAQEAETVSPGLVKDRFDSDETGKETETVTKSVSYSVLYMKAVKALQEAMERIETLEAKVAALEAQ